MGYYFHEKDDRAAQPEAAVPARPDRRARLPARRADDRRPERRDQRQCDARQPVRVEPVPRLAGDLRRAARRRSSRWRSPTCTAPTPIRPRSTRRTRARSIPPTSRRYFADEINAEIKIDHDFGKVEARTSRACTSATRSTSSRTTTSRSTARRATVAGLSAAGSMPPASGRSARARRADQAVAARRADPQRPGGPYCTSTPSTRPAPARSAAIRCAARCRSTSTARTPEREAYTGEAILTTAVRRQAQLPARRHLQPRQDDQEQLLRQRLRPRL